jgi:hypothetical protein
VEAQEAGLLMDRTLDEALQTAEVRTGVADIGIDSQLLVLVLLLWVILMLSVCVSNACLGPCRRLRKRRSTRPRARRRQHAR